MLPYVGSEEAGDVVMGMSGGTTGGSDLGQVMAVGVAVMDTGDEAAGGSDGGQTMATVGGVVS